MPYVVKVSDSRDIKDFKTITALITLNHQHDLYNLLINSEPKPKVVNKSDVVLLTLDMF